jgi:hypothetical protein
LSTAPPPWPHSQPPTLPPTLPQTRCCLDRGATTDPPSHSFTV